MFVCVLVSRDAKGGYGSARPRDGDGCEYWSSGDDDMKCCLCTYVRERGYVYCSRYLEGEGGEGSGGSGSEMLGRGRREGGRGKIRLEFRNARHVSTTTRRGSGTGMTTRVPRYYFSPAPHVHSRPRLADAEPSLSLRRHQRH